MGKRRKTAKTGDKAIYKSRNVEGNRRITEEESDLHDKVDHFHLEREKDFLELSQFQNPNHDEDDEENEEAVMDLGAQVDSSDESEEESSSGSDVDEPGIIRKDGQAFSSSSSSSDDDDDDDDRMELQLKEDVRDWGKRKALYYHGDTADLEIGQDQDDAFLEEEAAKEIQAARFEEMSEEDFALSDAEKSDDDSETGLEKLSSGRQLSKLSAKQRKKLLDKQHPEFLGLLSHFTSVVRSLESSTTVASDALFRGTEAPEVSGFTSPESLYRTHDRLEQKCLFGFDVLVEKRGARLNIVWVHLILRESFYFICDSVPLVCLPDTPSSSLQVHWRVKARVEISRDQGFAANVNGAQFGCVPVDEDRVDVSEWQFVAYSEPPSDRSSREMRLSLAKSSKRSGRSCTPPPATARKFGESCCINEWGRTFGFRRDE